MMHRRYWLKRYNCSNISDILYYVFLHTIAMVSNTPPYSTRNIHQLFLVIHLCAAQTKYMYNTCHFADCEQKQRKQNSDVAKHFFEQAKQNYVHTKHFSDRAIQQHVHANHFLSELTIFC